MPGLKRRHDTRGAKYYGTISNLAVMLGRRKVVSSALRFSDRGPMHGANFGEGPFHALGRIGATRRAPYYAEGASVRRAAVSYCRPEEGARVWHKPSKRSPTSSRVGWS